MPRRRRRSLPHEAQGWHGEVSVPTLEPARCQTILSLTLSRVARADEILGIVRSTQADVRSTQADMQVMKEASVQGMASEIPKLEFEVNSGAHTCTKEALRVATEHIKDCAGFASAEKQEEVLHVLIQFSDVLFLL